MSKLDWNSFKDLFHKSWWKQMKDIIESPEVFEIYQQLKKDNQVTKITPDSKNVFACFGKEIGILNTIIMGQDPYPQIDINRRRANGIAFDCSEYGSVSPSLQKLYIAMEDDCYNGMNLMFSKTNKSLDYLSNQGVMLCNAALTCKKDEPGSHYDLWIPFWRLIFDKIFATKSGLIFIFMGKKAQFFEQYTNSLHHVLKCEHPVKASYEKREMIHNNVFSKTNEILKKSNGFQIDWMDYDLPF